MSEKENKIIYEEKLEKVTGGNGLGYASDTYLPEDHAEHISADDACNHIGDEVYAIFDQTESAYFWGTLIDSKRLGVTSAKLHTIIAKDMSEDCSLYSENVVIGKNDISSIKWTLYKKTTV